VEPRITTKIASRKPYAPVDDFFRRSGAIHEKNVVVFKAMRRERGCVVIFLVVEPKFQR
jgi:hypothetical protein